MRKYEIMIIESEELNRNVKIFIKVPNDYYQNDKRYPVLFIHDGQVAFNDFEENMTDWGLMDDYLINSKQEVILVGIDSGKTRVDELCPFVIKSKTRGELGGKTDKYISFIVGKLMTIINREYRTLTGPENTGMMGISLGGVCTFYATTKYTDYFSKYAVISSAHYQVHNKLLPIINAADLSKISRFYSDVGTNESEKDDISIRYIETNKEIFNVIEQKLHKDNRLLKVVDKSRHEFVDWNKRFATVIEFLFS